MKQDTEFCNPDGSSKVHKVIHTSVKMLALREFGLSAGIIFFMSILAFAGITIILLYVAIVAAWLGAGAAIYFHWKREVFIITDKGVKICRGAIGTDIQEIEYSDIQGVKLKRNLLSFINIGTVLVETVPGDITMKSIDNPKEAMDLISDKM